MKTLSLIFLSFALFLFSGSAQADDQHNKCRHDPPPSANVSIPADDAVHVLPDGTFAHQYEQWYWNAYLKGPHGKLYGVETLIFQFNTFQPFIANIIQVSLTDVESGEYQNDLAFRFSDTGQGFPFIPNGFDIDLVDESTGAGLLAVGGAGNDDLVFTFSDGTVAEIRFNGLKHATPGFFDGFGAYTDPVTGESHGGQYYYNRRNMSAKGTITFPGKRPKHVKGVGWYDRQFGTVIGTPGTQAENVNWKWVSLHLFENHGSHLHGASSARGTDYVMWDMRANDTGNTLIHTINKIGPAPECEQELIEDFTIEGAGETIFSVGPPPTTFDLVNTLTIPEEGLELTIIPLVDDQIILSGGLFDPIYEGVMEAFGTRNGEPVHGYGYYEETQSCCQGLPQ